jgi:hypothetical protein
MKSYQENLLRSLSVTLFLIFISLFHLPVSFASDLIPIRTPSTGYQPQFQVSGNRIYYVYHEYDGPFRQIFTAEMNIDRTGWKAEKRTSGQYDKTFPQFQVAGNKIYYVRQQPDPMKNRQIWTMEMSVDGTGWKEVQRTNSPFDKQFPQLHAAGNRIYYTWNESDGKYRQIWTAEMGMDGTGWEAAKRTSSPFAKLEPQLKVSGDKIHLVWRESDGTHFQIWTAVMKGDGAGWQAVKRTNSPCDKHNPQLYLDGGKIYYAWHQADGSDSRKARYQIWTAQMNVDGSEWQAIQRTETPFDKYTPKLQSMGDKLYYVWEESDGKHRQIWTAQVNKDGTGCNSKRRTQSPHGKYDPQFQIIGNTIYYVWHEDHGPAEPIWVAEESIVE